MKKAPATAKASPLLLNQYLFALPLFQLMHFPINPRFYPLLHCNIKQNPNQADEQ